MSKVDDFIQHLDSSRFTLNGMGGVCSWALLDSKGAIKYKKIEAPCHAGFPGAKNAKSVINSLRLKNKELTVQSESFWKFIFCAKKSPWCKVLREGAQQFIYNNDHEIIGVKLSNMEGNLNGIANLLIASRIPLEYDQRLLTWYNLVHKEGLTEREAFLVSCLFVPRGEGIFAFSCHGGGHFPVSACGSINSHVFLNPEEYEWEGAGTVSGGGKYGFLSQHWARGKARQVNSSEFKRIEVNYTGHFPKHYDRVAVESQTVDTSSIKEWLGQEVKDNG